MQDQSINLKVIGRRRGHGDGRETCLDSGYRDTINTGLSLGDSYQADCVLSHVERQCGSYDDT